MFTGPVHAGANRSRQDGFSLAEIAIVVVLVGLLIGAVIIGRSLIIQSRIKSVVSQFEQLKVAILTYRDRYGALPGDDGRASSRWTDVKDGDTDGKISGSYQADSSNSALLDTKEGESLKFWLHLRRSGLVAAPSAAVPLFAQPVNPYAGLIGIEWAPLAFRHHAACMANFPGDIAIGVESQIDDGNPQSGSIHGAKQQGENKENQPIAAAEAKITHYQEASDSMYILCHQLD